MKDNVVHWLSKTESHLWESHLCQLLRNWKNKPWSKLKRLWCGSLNARRMLGRPCLKSSKAQPLRWSRATWKTKCLSWSTCKARWKRSKSLAWAIFIRWEPYLQTWANVFWLYTLNFHPHTFSMSLFSKFFFGWTITIHGKAASSARRSFADWMPWAEHMY